MTDKSLYPDQSICNRCGHCCRVIVNIYPFSEATAEWVMARGYRMLDSSEGFLAVEIPSRCPHLTEDNLCDLGDDRPQTCQLYPAFLHAREFNEMGLKLERILGQECGYAQAKKE